MAQGHRLSSWVLPGHQLHRDLDGRYVCSRINQHTTGHYTEGGFYWFQNAIETDGEAGRKISYETGIFLDL